MDFDEEASELDFRRGVDPNSVYELTSLLGEGSYGAVYKGKSRIDSLGDEVAIKIIPDADDDLTSLWREIRFLQVLRSPFVVSFIESLLFDNELWLVMELCDGGSLYDLKEATRGPFNESQLRAIMAFSTLGLAHLHSQMSIHRDVKSGNILLTKDGKAKLGDFGISAQLTDTIMKRRTVIGSPYWMAPEVIQETSYDSKADIWSLGITLLELCEGNPPHFNVHPMRAIFIISSRPAPTLKEPSLWSEAMNDFVSKCLVKNAENRSSAAELVKHPWLRTTVKEIGVTGRGHHLLEQLVRDNWEEIERVRFSRFKMPDNIPVGVDGNSGNVIKSPEHLRIEATGSAELIAQNNEIDENMVRTIPRINSFGNPNSLGFPATRQQLRNASLKRSSTPTAAMRVRSASRALPQTATLLNEYLQNGGAGVDSDDCGAAVPKPVKFSASADSAVLGLRKAQDKYAGLDLKGDSEELKRDYQRDNNKVKRRKSVSRNNLMRYSGSNDDAKYSDESTVDERETAPRHNSRAGGSRSQESPSDFSEAQQYSSLVRSPPTPPPNGDNTATLSRSVIKSKFGADPLNCDEGAYSPSYASAALNDISGFDAQNSMVAVDSRTKAQPKASAAGRGKGMQAALKYFRDEPLPDEVIKPNATVAVPDSKESKLSPTATASSNLSVPNSGAFTRLDQQDAKTTTVAPAMKGRQPMNLSTGGITFNGGGARRKNEVAVLNTLVQLEGDPAQQPQYIKKEILKQIAALKKQYQQDIEYLSKAYENRRKVLKEALFIYSSAAELNEIGAVDALDSLADMSLSPLNSALTSNPSFKAPSGTSGKATSGAAVTASSISSQQAAVNSEKAPTSVATNSSTGGGSHSGTGVNGLRTGVATPSTVNDIYSGPSAASRDDMSVSTESTANVNNPGGNNGRKGKKGKGKSRGGGGQSHDAKH